MDEGFIKLTNTAYKVIEFFPESDPLKNRAKDRVLLLMENLILLDGIEGWASFQNDKIKTQVIEDVDILLGYFWIAKCQGWLNSTNYLIISNEYKKIKEEIELRPLAIRSLGDLPSAKAGNGNDKKDQLSNRQRKILEFLAGNEKAQVMDLQKILPDVTKRTIRRDLYELLGAGKIIRMGEFNEVFYKISENKVLES